MTIPSMNNMANQRTFTSEARGLRRKIVKEIGDNNYHVHKRAYKR